MAMRAKFRLVSVIPPDGGRSPDVEEWLDGFGCEHTGTVDMGGDDALGFVQAGMKGYKLVVELRPA